MSHLVGGRVSEGSDFSTFDFTVLLSKAHFVCLVACFLFRFVKLFVCFCKDENIVIHAYTYHTTYFLNSKIVPIFLWFCLTCKLEN